MSLQYLRKTFTPKRYSRRVTSLFINETSGYQSWLSFSSYHNWKLESHRFWSLPASVRGGHVESEETRTTTDNKFLLFCNTEEQGERLVRVQEFQHRLLPFGSEKKVTPKTISPLTPPFTGNRTILHRPHPRAMIVRSILLKKGQTFRCRFKTNTAVPSR